MVERSTKVKIFIFLPTLNGGGAQRVALHIIKNIDTSVFEAVLVVSNKIGDYVTQLSPGIRVIDLGKKRPKDSIVPLARLLHREKPDIVLSYMHNSNTIAILANLLAGLPSRIICAERNVIEQLNLRFFLVRKIVDRLLYYFCSRIVVSSNGMAENVRKYFRCAKDKIVVIYNPIDIEYIKRKSEEPVDYSWLEHAQVPIIAGLGRLVPQKGFDTLISSFAEVRKNTKSKLIILGQGELEQSLKKLASNLEVGDDVVFLGFQKNPYAFLNRSDIFVMSSRWEGMPNTLSEAMAVGVPIVSTTCNYGPTELIEDGKEGILTPVDNVKEMTVSIKRFLDDKAWAKKCSDDAQKKAELYSLEKIVKQYQDVFQRVL